MSGKRKLTGVIFVILSPLLLVLHIAVTLTMTESWWDYEAISILVFAIFAPPLFALIGIPICLVQKPKFWPFVATVGFVSLIASSAWALSCLTMTPFPVTFDVTKGFDRRANDELIVRNKRTSDSGVTAPTQISESVYLTLQHGRRIWQDGSEQMFSCEYIRDGKVLYRFDAMSSGNLVVEDRLYQAPPGFDAFLRRAF